jgi:hypothetical protein
MLSVMIRGASERNADGPGFDRYVVVDWSASARPARGADSIWVCEAGRDGPPVAKNPSSCGEAERIVRGMLLAASSRGERALVCFDFPYGYPRGTADALRLRGEPWRALWTFLRERVHDDPVSNRNDRFEVASEINAWLASHAFWGAPTRRSFAHLSRRRDLVRYRIDPAGAGLAEWRQVEEVLRGRGYRPHSVWKLLGAGSVGGQALVGIPVVACLRHDPALSPVSAVWPFEVGVPRFPAGRPAIVHAEIRPSLTPVGAVEGRIRDEVRVTSLARRLRAEDRSGALAALFAAARPAASREEGWILGVE